MSSFLIGVLSLVRSGAVTHHDQWLISALRACIEPAYGYRALYDMRPAVVLKVLRYGLALTQPIDDGLGFRRCLRQVGELAANVDAEATACRDGDGRITAKLSLADEPGIAPCRRPAGTIWPMTNCPHCHQPIADDARDCPACGREIGPRPAAAAPAVSAGNPADTASAPGGGPAAQVSVRQRIGTIMPGGRNIGLWIERAVGPINYRTENQAAVQNRRDKGELLKRVRANWIAGHLERVEATQVQLHQQGLIQLHRTTVPDAVTFLPPAAADVAFQRTAGPAPPLEGSIAAIYRQTQRSLLILGRRGAGKTVTLLQLARDLIEQAEQDPDAPAPVILSLSTWATDRSSLADWVVDELQKIQYQVPTSIGRRWVASGDLVLLLDGLDEVAGQYRDDCARAINVFVDTHGLTGLVVCCQLEEYQRSEALHLRAAIQLEPLLPEQIDAFFVAAGPELAGLRAAVDQDAPLQALVDRPLMLHLMSLAYRNAPADAIGGPLDSVEPRRQQLFEDYVQRMLRPAGDRRPPYTAAQTTAWLGWLARRLHEHGLATFWIEEMQPSWLPTSGWRWAYMIGSRLALGLGGGLLGGLLIGLGLVPVHGIGPAIQLGLAEGLIGGLVAGPVVGLLDMSWITWLSGRRHIRRRPLGLQLALKALGVGVIVGVSVAALFTTSFGSLRWLEREPVEWFREGLSVGIVFALSCVLLFAFGPRGVRHRLDSDIQTVEQLHWSVRGALRGAVFGIIAGVLAGAVGGLVGQHTQLIAPLVARGWATPAVVAASALMAAFFLGVAGAAFGGLGGTLVTTKKVVPNEGLRLSLVNAAVVGALVGALFAGLGALYGLILAGGHYAVTYAFYGCFVGLLAALWYGGLFAIQHATLRLLLWRLGKTPRVGQLANFLDYATSCILLDRVGGGYSFVHPYLQEHIAAMARRATRPD